MTIADNLQTLIDCKADMKSAIEERGVTVSGGLSTYADAIRQIDKKIIYNKYPIGKEETESCIANNLEYQSSYYVNKDTGVWTLRPYDAQYYPSSNPNIMSADDCYWGYPKWKIKGDKVTGEAGHTASRSGHVFYGLENIQYIPYLDVSELNDIRGLFCDLGTLKAIGGFDTSKYDNLCCLFAGDWNLRKIPYLETSHVKTFDDMFEACLNLIEIPSLKLTNATSCVNMFRACSNLTTIPIDFTDNKIRYASYMFHECTSLTKIGDINVDNMHHVGSMFLGCKSLTEVPNLIGSFKWDEYGNCDMGGMFAQCHSLTSIKKINTTGGTNMNYMFGYCRNLTEILEIDTSEAKDMRSMFEQCNALKTLPMLDAGNVRYIDEYTFIGCKELENFGGLKDIGKVIDYNHAYGMDLSFHQCTKLTHESLMNIINNLYDRYSAYGPNSGRYLLLSRESNKKLTDEEIAIAVNKGWTVEII